MVGRSFLFGDQMINQVSVVIAAKDAASTIERAVRSAAGQPEALEVIVVDDGSRDDTAERARRAGGAKVIVERLEINRGPAAARNLAFARARGQFLCILDADDFMHETRLRDLLAQSEGYDFVADDLWLAGEDAPDVIRGSLTSDAWALPLDLDLVGFVRGNLAANGEKRRELGFLKPLIRREFIEAKGLAYDEGLRLGEDYIFYAQALMAGARFLLTPACGYVAVERSDSLSGQHRTADLEALAAAAGRLPSGQALPAAEASALKAYSRNIQDRAVHRRVLDIKREQGAAKAALYALRHWRSAPHVLSQTLRDKLPS